MSMDISNLVIDRILRGTMFSTTDRSALWSVSQISSFTLTVSTDKSTAVDATGTPIMDFYRAKTCSIDAENALWDIGLSAAQGGSALNASSADNTYTVPMFDEIEVGTTATSVTLTRTPVAPSGETYAVPYVYLLNGDGTLGTRFECAASTSAGKYTQAGTTLTFASGDLETGDTILAVYEYTANGTSGSQALALSNTAKDFPTAGKFVMEVLACNPCDKSTLYYAYVVFPSATLSPDIDLSFSTDSKHSFKMDAQQDYCDKEKVLYRIYVPESAANA